MMATDFINPRFCNQTKRCPNVGRLSVRLEEPSELRGKINSEKIKDDKKRPTETESSGS